LPRPARVVIGVAESPAGLRALRTAVEQARFLGREVLAVRAFATPSDRDLLQRTGMAAMPGYPRTASWTHASRTTIDAREQEETRVIGRAFEQAMGGLPDDLVVRPTARLGTPGSVLVEAAYQDDDLLIVGAAHRRSRLRRSTGRYCLIKARCPVLVVPPHDLARRVIRKHSVRQWDSDLEAFLAENPPAEPRSLPRDDNPG
jgi:nucleotide-binding universal stress UspA family protein